MSGVGAGCARRPWINEARTGEKEERRSVSIDEVSERFEILRLVHVVSHGFVKSQELDRRMGTTAMLVQESSGDLGEDQVQNDVELWRSEEVVDSSLPALDWRCKGHRERKVGDGGKDVRFVVQGNVKTRRTRR